MLSIIHSPEYVFTVLVSIFISKNHNHFSSDIQISWYWYIYGKSDRVLCFYYLRMHIVNDTYHIQTYSNLRLQHYVSAFQC